MNENKHTHGFKIPDTYLDSFEDSLMERMALETLPKEAPFKVPDGYLEGVEDTIMAKVSSKDTIKVIPLFRKNTILWATSIAACLLIALTFYNRDTNFGNINTSEIEAYVISDAFSLETDEIALLLTDEELNNLSFEKQLFSEENLENYLLENLDDTTLLIE